jgi:hypothetical protein
VSLLIKNSVILSLSKDQPPATSLITGNVRLKVPFEGEISQKVGWLVNAVHLRGLIPRQAQDDGILRSRVSRRSLEGRAKTETGTAFRSPFQGLIRWRAYLGRCPRLRVARPRGASDGEFILTQKTPSESVSRDDGRFFAQFQAMPSTVNPGSPASHPFRITPHEPIPREGSA